MNILELATILNRITEKPSSPNSGRIKAVSLFADIRASTESIQCSTAVHSKYEISVFPSRGIEKSDLPPPFRLVSVILGLSVLLAFMCTICMPGTPRSQKRALDPLELEFHKAPGSPARTAPAPNH